MTNRLGLVAAAVMAIALVCVMAHAADPNVPYTQPAQPVERSLLLDKPFIGGGDGGWDCITVDDQARRVYVARANRVMVFDADKGTDLGEVAGINGAHGVAIVPGDKHEGFATAGKDNAVVVFDTTTFKTGRKIAATSKPDVILYDPASKKVFAFNHGDGQVTIIDPAAQDKPTNLAVGGKLEFGATDEAGKVYVNVEDKSEVVAIDSKQGKVLAHWPIKPGEEPTGLAIDPVKGRLFIGCGNKMMIVMDATNGKVLASLPIGAGVDGVAFDAKSGLAVSANGRDGTMSVVKEGPAGKFAVVQTLPTAKGARTVEVDPKTGRFFLPCQVPGADGSKTSFGLLVVSPAGK